MKFTAWRHKNCPVTYTEDVASTHYGAALAFASADAKLDTSWYTGAQNRGVLIYVQQEGGDLRTFRVRISHFKNPVFKAEEEHT